MDVMTQNARNMPSVAERELLKSRKRKQEHEEDEWRTSRTTKKNETKDTITVEMPRKGVHGGMPHHN